MCCASSASPSSSVIRVPSAVGVHSRPASEVERAQNGLQSAADVRFGSAERRQPVRREQPLRLTQIVAAKDEIVEQVGGARQLRRRDPGEERLAGAIDRATSPHRSLEVRWLTPLSGDTRRTYQEMYRRPSKHAATIED